MTWRAHLADVKRAESGFVVLTWEAEKDCRYCGAALEDEVQLLYGLCSTVCAKYEDRFRGVGWKLLNREK